MQDSEKVKIIRQLVPSSSSRIFSEDGKVKKSILIIVCIISIDITLRDVKEKHTFKHKKCMLRFEDSHEAS